MSNPSGYIEMLILNYQKEICILCEQLEESYAPHIKQLHNLFFHAFTGLSFEMSNASRFELNGSFSLWLVTSNVKVFSSLNGSTLSDFPYFCHPWMTCLYRFALGDFSYYQDETTLLPSTTWIRMPSDLTTKATDLRTTKTLSSPPNLKDKAYIAATINWKKEEAILSVVPAWRKRPMSPTWRRRLWHPC